MNRNQTGQPGAEYRVTGIQTTKTIIHQKAEGMQEDP